MHTTARDEGSASHYFNRLLTKASLRWHFDASKDLSCHSSAASWYLEDYSATASDFVQMSPVAVKAAAVRDQLLLGNGASLSLDEAASLQGKFKISTRSLKDSGLYRNDQWSRGHQ